MIRSLRVRHRRSSLALAVLLPLGVAAGLWSRGAQPLQHPLPEALLPADPAEGALLWERADLWPQLEITTRLRSGNAGPVVELEPRSDLRRPDVLVYWAGAEAADERLPEDAFLLGRLPGAQKRRFSLPAPARAGGGRLYLYSLGHQEILGSASLAGAGPS